MEQFVDFSGRNDPIHLRDFDLLGMVELNDDTGIENLVTPTGDGKYISRAEPYFAKYTCAGASRYREYLKGALPFVYGKKAFVILDYMCNFSGKVYYEEIQRAVNQGDSSHLEQAKLCLLEDVRNMIRLLEGKELLPSTQVLPESDDTIAPRCIECNNMGLLYIYTKCFEVPEGFNVLNTGLGGIFLGPFFKVIHGTEWTNVLRSKYVDEKHPDGVYSLETAMVKPETFEPSRKVLLLDDNIGTGDTTREIVTELIIDGYDVKYGAVQYNWRNFFLVGEGKKDIKRFNPFEIDYVTMFNYPGHKLIKHANSMICGDRDICGNEPSLDFRTPWGQIYRDYKAKKHYDIPGLSDLVTLQYKGIKNSCAAGIKIYDEFNRNRRYSKIFSKDSRELMERIDEFTSKYLIGPTFFSDEMKNDGPKFE